MKNKNLSDDELRFEISDIKEYIAELYYILSLMPEKTLLGRLSLKATINQQQRRLDKFESELNRRGILDDNDS